MLPLNEHESLIFAQVICTSISYLAIILQTIMSTLVADVPLGHWPMFLAHTAIMVAKCNKTGHGHNSTAWQMYARQSTQRLGADAQHDLIHDIQPVTSHVNNILGTLTLLTLAVDACAHVPSICLL